MDALIPATAILLLALPAEGVLERRAAEVQACVRASPAWSEELYDATFLAAVPPEKLKEIYRTFFEEHGAIVAMPIVSKDSPHAAKLEAVFEKGVTMPVSLTISTTPPHGIVGLWFGPPSPAVPSLEALAKEMEKLPGRASLLLTRLGEAKGAPAVLAELRADEPMAIGSTFKLYVLGALASEVAARKRSLDDVVRLDERFRSLPSGMLQEWPRGAPVTLHTLATLMISVSDNTATDHLLHILGRKRVEEMLVPMGNESAARNRPFLSTAEMFRLKCAEGGRLAGAYVAKDLAGRAALLEGEVARVPLDLLDLAAVARPTMIDRIEWFASTRDLCRAMDWLRRTSEGGSGSAAILDVLAVNPGLDVPKARFPYVGYKGGSEGGVLNLTYLLRDVDGRWYALSATWNDTAAPLDEMRFFGLVTRALHLLAKETTPAEPASR